MWWAWVQSLVRELKSHKPHSVQPQNTKKKWYKQSIEHCARPTIGTWKCIFLLYWTCIPSSFPLKNALVFLVMWITCDWFHIELQREKLTGLSCQYNAFPWSQQLVLRQTHEQDQVIKTPFLDLWAIWTWVMPAYRSWEQLTTSLETGRVLWEWR